MSELRLDKANTGLVTADVPTTMLDRPDVKIFDVGGTWSTPARALTDAYDRAHIPGAIFLDWTQEFLEPEVPLKLASVASFEIAHASFERLGIHDGDTVVLYDDRFHMFAGRLPGTINVPYSSMLNPDTGAFLDSTEIAGRLDSAAPGWRGKRVITSCGSGYAGTVPLLALHALGVQGALFDGSFAVWKQEPTRSVEQSPTL